MNDLSANASEPLDRSMDELIEVMIAEGLRHEYLPVPARCRCGWDQGQAGARGNWQDWRHHANESVITAALAHRQRSVCGECEGSGTDRCGISDAPCDICGGSGTVEGETVLTLRSAVRAEVEGEYEQVGWARERWYPEDTPDNFPFLLTTADPHVEAAEPVYRHRVELPHRSEP